MVHFSSKFFNSASLKLREAFKLPDKNVLRWFPGHMDKGFKQMQQKLKSVDCIIEIHDARIPLSGRNPNFKHSIGGLKPLILVLNKMDLADLKKQKEIEKIVRREGSVNEVLFTNCKVPNCKGIKSIVPLAKKLILASDRYNRSELKEFCLMVIGVPNVGKSTVLNNLRNLYLKKGGGAPVGAVAGITRSVTTRYKVCEDPLVYILDTPGILTPNIPDIETGMKLALCSTTKDSLVGPKNIADYLLYWLNKNNHFRYVQQYDLQEACDHIGLVLAKIAIINKLTFKGKNVCGEYESKLNLYRAADIFIEDFRKGALGKYLLDEDILFSRVNNIAMTIS